MNLNSIYFSWNHIYNCFSEILQMKFLQYIVVFLSRDLPNQFQLRACNVYPPPPNFSTDFAFFREWFLWRLGGGAVAPPLWLCHCTWLTFSHFSHGFKIINIVIYCNFINASKTLGMPFQCTKI